MLQPIITFSLWKAVFAGLAVHRRKIDQQEVRAVLLAKVAIGKDTSDCEFRLVFALSASFECWAKGR